MTQFIPTAGTAPVPCEVISTHGKHTYIAVLDKRDQRGKRIWTNTDTHGCTMIIETSQLVNNG